MEHSITSHSCTHHSSIITTRMTTVTTSARPSVLDGYHGDGPKWRLGKQRISKCARFQSLNVDQNMHRKGKPYASRPPARGLRLHLRKANSAWARTHCSIGMGSRSGIWHGDTGEYAKTFRLPDRESSSSTWTRHHRVYFQTKGHFSNALQALCNQTPAQWSQGGRRQRPHEGTWLRSSQRRGKGAGATCL